MNGSFQEQIGRSVFSSKLKEYPGGINVPCRNCNQEWRTTVIVACVNFGSLFNEECDEFRLVKKSSSRDKKVTKTSVQYAKNVHGAEARSERTNRYSLYMQGLTGGHTCSGALLTFCARHLSNVHFYTRRTTFKWN